MSFDADLEGAPIGRAIGAIGQGAKKAADAPADVVKQGIGAVERIADKAASKSGTALRAPASVQAKSVSYSALYGLLMNAAKRATGTAANALALAAGAVRSSAKSAGKALSDKADAFTKPALASLEEASAKGGAAIEAAARRMGDKGAAVLDAYRAILAAIPGAMTGYARSMGIVAGAAVVLLALGGGVYLVATTRKR